MVTLFWGLTIEPARVRLHIVTTYRHSNHHHVYWSWAPRLGRPA